MNHFQGLIPSNRKNILDSGFEQCETMLNRNAALIPRNIVENTSIAKFTLPWVERSHFKSAPFIWVRASIAMETMSWIKFSVRYLKNKVNVANFRIKGIKVNSFEIHLWTIFSLLRSGKLYLIVHKNAFTRRTIEVMIMY